MDTTDPVAELERVVIGAVGLTTRALAEAAPGTDLTFPQWRALLILGEDADGARVGQVAARVGVTLPATSRLLRRLAARGLVTLGSDEQDHRATRARLTESGAAVRASILRYRLDALREVAAAMDTETARPFGATVAALADALGAFA
jgi:DNA-binding MarR family transcriptional regulator